MGGEIKGWEPLRRWTGTDESTGPEETQLLFHLFWRNRQPTNWGGQSLRAEIFILKTGKKKRKKKPPIVQIKKTTNIVLVYHMTIASTVAMQVLCCQTSEAV